MVDMIANSKKYLPVVTLIITTICITWFSWIPQPLRAADDDQATKIDKLTERVTTLEKAVLDDPLHPKSTVLARLDAIEERLKKVNKLGEADAKTVAHALDAVKDDQKEIVKMIERMERRLKEVEQDKGADGAAGDVKELKRSLDHVQKAVDDLKGRVGKLEDKR